MSETRQPPQADEEFNDGFERELKEMWQESTCAMPGAANEPTLKLAEWVARFDRKVFWQNFVEYVAVGIVLTRTGFDIASGDRPLVASLASIAAAVFIASCMWRKHRDTPRLHPEASANAYRDALLARLDRQIELARSVRYWYVLPAWLFLVVLFASRAVRMLANSAESRSIVPGVFFLTVEFLLATGICVLVIWVNEHYRVRKLREERAHVESVMVEGSEEGLA
jgi:hypothetical protein